MKYTYLFIVFLIVLRIAPCFAQERLSIRPLVLVPYKSNEYNNDLLDQANDIFTSCFDAYEGDSLLDRAKIAGKNTFLALWNDEDSNYQTQIQGYAQVIGFIHGARKAENYRSFFIEYLATKQDEQGKGVGSEMLRLFPYQFTEEPITEVELHPALNTLEFYRKNNFKLKQNDSYGKETLTAYLSYLTT